MGILTQEIKDFVNKQKLGFVATVCPDGTPNLSPKGTTIAWDEDHLAFADIHSPETVSNLLHNPSIEINVVDIFARKGYRFKGIGKVFDGGPIFEQVNSFYRAAGSKHVIKNIVLIKIVRVTEIKSPSYYLGLTEEEIKKRWVDYWNDVNNKK